LSDPGRMFFASVSDTSALASFQGDWSLDIFKTSPEGQRIMA
jgi:hypothetical protein